MSSNLLIISPRIEAPIEEGTDLGKLCQEHPDIIELVEPENADQLIAGIRLALEKPAYNKFTQD